MVLREVLLLEYPNALVSKLRAICLDVLREVISNVSIKSIRSWKPVLIFLSFWAFLMV